MPKDKPEEITIQTWWKPGGGMMYNRECLPPNHPEHIYNYVKREFGVDPEEYGIPDPVRVRHNARVMANHLQKRGFNVDARTVQEIYDELEREDICDPDYEANYRY